MPWGYCANCGSELLSPTMEQHLGISYDPYQCPRCYYPNDERLSEKDGLRMLVERLEELENRLKEAKVRK